MEMGTSSKARRCLGSQQIHCILCPPNVLHQVHNRPLSLVRTLSEANRVYTFRPYFFKIHFNIIIRLRL